MCEESARYDLGGSHDSKRAPSNKLNEPSEFQSIASVEAPRPFLAARKKHLTLDEHEDIFAYLSLWRSLRAN